MTSVPASTVCHRRDRPVLLASALVGGLAVALCSLRLASLSTDWLVATGSLGLAAAAAGDDVERLIEGVERVAAGDYDVGFDLDRDDQLGDLAAALDELVDGVARREDDLEREIEYTGEVLDAIDDVFYVLDREGEHQQWNETIADVTGFDPSEIASMGPLDYFEGDDEATIATAIDEAFETGHTRVEADLRTVDEEVIPYEWIANRLTAPDGTPVVAGIGRDISERRERERELERQASLLDSLFEQVPVNIYLKDEEARHVRTSAPYLREDRPAEEWYVGKSDLEIYSRDTAEETYADDRRVIDSGEPIIEKEEYDEGAGRWLLTSKVPWRGEDGEIRGLIGVSQDITEQKERQQELERMRYLMRQAQQIAHVGGWELDLRSDRHTFEGTEEFYRIHDLPPDAEFDHETALEYYHVDDRERIADVMTDAIERGTSYDVEARLTTGDHGVRWVRAIAEPVTEDGDVVALRGSIQDITERKEQELTLQSLHELARGLLEAESRKETADLVLDAGTTVLGFPYVAIYLLEEAGRLEPAALSPEFDEICGDPTASFDAADSSILWDAYVGGEVMEVDESTFGDSSIVTEATHRALLLPIGEHGVLLVASDREEITADHRRVAETLVATMETALHRLDSAEALRTNQRQLEEQNRRLRRQIQITEIIRRVDRSLVGAGTREEIESAVCERLVESDDVAFAWIGGLDDRNASVVPRTWAGAGHEYLDAISLSTAEETPDPAVRAAASGESALAESVVEAVASEQWRKHALVWNFSSVIAVPLELDEFSYGVLAVYGTEPGAFGDLERSVFEELGESIANAINAVEARRALYADEFAELRLRFDGDEDFLGRVAAASGATVEYVGLATHADGESRLFFETSDVDPEGVRTALDELHTVREYRQIGEAEGPTLFEATVVGTVLAAKLVSRGGVPRSMAASGGELSVVVDVPTATDVREFVGMFRERHPSAELVARQNVRRDVQTRQEVVAGLFDDLTDRQLEVLRTAFFAGFFEWPRESTGEEVADLLGVSQPTVNRHLRHGLARLLEQLFEEEPTAVASAEPQ